MKLLIDVQALAEAGDKGEKNLGFYTGRSNKHHPCDYHPNPYRQVKYHLQQTNISNLSFVTPILIRLFLMLIFIKHRVGKDLVEDLRELGGVSILFTLTFQRAYIIIGKCVFFNR